jgi:glycosyltransferase involved in cell wall biosynthesis
MCPDVRDAPADDMREVPTIAEGLFSYQIGGSERVGVDLALEFQRRGYRVVCFAFQDSDGPMRAELERAGIRCVDMNYGKCTGVLRRLRYYLRFARMLRTERVRALHVHHHGALILCGIPARIAGVSRVVMTEHGLQALRERAQARKLTMRYARYASDITVVEPAQADYFHAALGVPTAKLHCVQNGIRLPLRTAASVAKMRLALAIAPDVFAFFYVGRLNPVKDLGTLLEGFARLPDDVRNRSRLYLVGEGSERAMLESRRAALGLTDRVVFLGARYDVSELLMAADAFVMSSKSEGLPMVLLEAMAARVPCVATAVGGIPNLFGSDRGVAVPPQDPAALADAMASVARSAELRARLVANALENLRRNHQFDAIVDRYLQLLGLPERVAPCEAAAS